MTVGTICKYSMVAMTMLASSSVFAADLRRSVAIDLEMPSGSNAGYVNSQVLRPNQSVSIDYVDCGQQFKKQKEWPSCIGRRVKQEFHFHLSLDEHEGKFRLFVVPVFIGKQAANGKPTWVRGGQFEVADRASVTKIYPIDGEDWKLTVQVIEPTDLRTAQKRKDGR